jgi:hypothetical protein
MTKLGVVLMRVSLSFFAHGIGHAIAEDPFDGAPPNAFMTELGDMRYTLYNSVPTLFPAANVDGKPEIIELETFTHTRGTNALVVRAKKRVRCTDAFYGLANFNKQKISDVISTSSYDFCLESKGAQVDTSLYNIEPRLNCNPPYSLMRLDCKFIPKAHPNAAFIASRIGPKARIVGKAVRGAKGLMNAVLGDGDGEQRQTQLFQRVRCDNQLEEKNMNECISLLRAWSAVDAAFESKPGSEGKEPDATAAADKKKSNAEGDTFDLNITSPYVLYIGGGVLALAVIAIAVVILKPSPEKVKDKRNASKSTKHKKHDPADGADEHDQPDTPLSPEADEEQSLLEKPRKSKSRKVK